ncbi:MAG: GspH/FimT family pseudopilin [Zoogloea sp.]|uniref:GspH/FimT family pseudopilin n=1 Tax=Zoogloea sp. TaxID=49181 RepID=UPI002601B5D0|nr:GspH/FimT family pseudopilin [Zoogloea sp.]MDD2987396.1 GspH/FimT family pseudopilin [Zoogloea sp.]
MLNTQRPAQQGFTLLELLVVLIIGAILLSIAVPSMTYMIRNNSVGAAAEVIQNALRQAEGEAIRRNGEVDFILTDGTPSVATVGSLTAKADGDNWVVRMADSTAANRYVNGISTSQMSSDVVYQGPAGVRFNGSGRVLDLSSAPVGSKQVFRVSRASATVAYCVFVTPGGAVKMCDPSKASGDPRACQPMLSATDCPAA